MAAVVCGVRLGRVRIIGSPECGVVQLDFGRWWSGWKESDIPFTRVVTSSHSVDGVDHDLKGASEVPAAPPDATLKPLDKSRASATCARGTSLPRLADVSAIRESGSVASR